MTMLRLAAVAVATQIGSASSNHTRQALASTENHVTRLETETALPESLGGAFVQRPADIQHHDRASLQISHNGALIRKQGHIQHHQVITSSEVKSFSMLAQPNPASVAHPQSFETTPSVGHGLFTGDGDECILLAIQEQRTNQWVACGTSASLGCSPCSIAPEQFGGVSPSVVCASVSVTVLLLFLAGLWDLSLSTIGADAGLVGESDVRADSGGGVPASLKYVELLRFLGAAHILELHFYLGTAISVWGQPLLGHTSINIAEWGFTWVSFFFMLSGFVHMYNAGSVELSSQANLQSSKQGRSRAFIAHIFVAQGWLRRAYPIHMLGLFISVKFGPVQGLVISVQGLLSLLGTGLCNDLLLVDTWIPGTWNGTYLNTPTWFLSALFLLGFLFDVCAKPLRRLTSAGCALVIVVCYAFTAVPFAMQQFIGINIFNASNEGNVGFRHQLWWPFSHWPTYVAGMALAQLYIQLASCAATPWISKVIATAFVTASIVLVCLFIFATPWRLYVWLTTGLLLPIHASLVFGLGWIGQQGGSTTSQSLKDTVVAALGRLALPIYILQVPVLTALNVQCGTRCSSLQQPIWPCVQISILFVVSFVVSHGIEMLVASSRAIPKQAPAVL